MRKILFVINPVAGNGDGKKLISVLKEEFFNCENDIVISPKYGVITDLVKEKLKDGQYTDVIAVGGDGTLAEVINGSKKFDVNIGIIPIGSGNDFAKTLHISKNIDEAIEIIKSSYIRKVYSGNINGIDFINVVGIGIDAEVLNYKENSKLLKGKLNYLVSTIKGMINYTPTEKSIYIDGKLIKEVTTFIAIGNGKYIGNGMKITPNANIEEKEFEICIVNKMKKHILIKSISKLYKGRHGEVDGVEFYHGKEISIEFDNDTFVDIDGSLLSCKNLYIKKNDIKLKFLVKE